MNELEIARAGARAQIEGSNAFILISFSGGEVQWAFLDGTAAENLAISGFMDALLEARRAGVLAELVGGVPPA